MKDNKFSYIGGEGQTIFIDTYNATIKKTDVCGTISARFDKGIRKDLTGGCLFLVIETSSKSQERK